MDALGRRHAREVHVAVPFAEHEAAFGQVRKPVEIALRENWFVSTFAPWTAAV
jgi:hypothetical protein